MGWHPSVLSRNPRASPSTTQEKEMFTWKARPGCLEMKHRFGMGAVLDGGSSELGLWNELEKSLEALVRNK